MRGSSENDLGLVDPSAAEPSACNSSDEQGSSGGWLDSLAIIIKQTSCRKGFVSTLELQLTSFDTCVVCRDVRTLRVTVNKYMPLSLWGDDQSSSNYPKTSDRRRQLPSLRAAEVSWNMPIAMIVPILSETGLLKGVTRMRVVGKDGLRDTVRTAIYADSKYVPSLLPLARPLHTPGTYFAAAMWTFRDPRHHARHLFRVVDSLSWPPALQELSLSCTCQERIVWEALPSSLERLELIGVFKDGVANVVWPASLKQLTLGGYFDHPIADVTWPSSLLELVFGDDFNRPIADVEWPTSLTSLIFGASMNQVVTHTVWPASLTKLVFGRNFAQPIGGVVWPATLVELSFRGRFDQPIADVDWPASLRRLTFGWFNQPIAGVRWPALLLELSFGHSFDQPIAEVAWPASLTKLEFGDRFNRQVDAVAWPSGLRSLAFGKMFDQPIRQLVLPASLMWLTFDGQPAELVRPPSLESLTLR